MATKIIIAKNIGFCSGVKRAIAIAEKALIEDKRPIQFLGRLVHNEKIIEKFMKAGVKFVKDPRDAKTGTLIIQAHGFPPFLNKNSRLIIRDATCTLVRMVQTAARSLYKKGYRVIIIGDRKHSETKGIKGYGGNKAIIVENEKEARKLPEFKKMGVVSQTTQNLDNINRILEILKSKAEKIKFINTLCPEVQNRQKELEQIVKRADAILVIGSRLSANTRRLAEKVKSQGKRIIWVNSLEELKKKNLKNISLLGLVSGASTPDWEIEKIKKHFN